MNRTMAEIRDELDWLEINAHVFGDDVDEWVKIEARRREVIAEMYGMIGQASDRHKQRLKLEEIR